MRICAMGFRGFPGVEGGVEKHCEELYPRMSEDLEIAVFRRRSYVNSQEKYDRIEFVDLPSTNIKGIENIIHSYLCTKRIAKMKPDLVHIHNIGAMLFTDKLAKRGIPMVMTYHSPNYEHAKWGSFAKKLLLHSEKVAFKNTDRIIFVNRFQMEKFPEEVRAKSVYIPNGMSRPVLSENTDYLEKIGVEPGKFVLSVGRITPEKGFDDLIKGFEKSRHRGYKLVIAGGVEFESKYMEELRSLCGNDVVFTGFVIGDSLAQLYTHAAQFVLASHNEGFPLVLLEAMSYGLDVLVSDIPATHLVKLDDSCYFECGDTDTLAEKLSERLISPEKKDYDSSEFDWDNVAERTESVYKDVLNKGKQR